MAKGVSGGKGDGRIGGKSGGTPSSLLTTRLFAVWCPFSRDYFIADDGDLSHERLVSKITGDPIPGDQRTVQLLRTDSLHVWTDQQVGKAVKALRGGENVNRSKATTRQAAAVAPIQAAWPSTITSTAIDHAEWVAEALSKMPVAHEGQRDSLRATAKDAALFEQLGAEYSYDASYWQLHAASYDVWNDHVLVFTVGRGGALLQALPLPPGAGNTLFEANNGVQQGRKSDNKEEKEQAELIDDAIKVGCAAGILVEIGILIGKLLGVQTNAAKANEAIQKALENSRVLAAIMRFIEKVRAGAAGLIDEVLDLLRLLYDQGVLRDLMTGLLAGAFSLFGIIWLIAKLFGKLVPGLGWAYTAAEILAWIGGGGGEDQEAFGVVCVVRNGVSVLRRRFDARVSSGLTRVQHGRAKAPFCSAFARRLTRALCSLSIDNP